MGKYLEDRELNSVLENYFDSSINNSYESDDMIKIQEGVYFDVLNEKAKFNFAINFKDDKSTTELWKVAKEAEDFLNKNGINTKTDAEKGWNIAFKILRYFANFREIYADTQGIKGIPTGIKIAKTSAAIFGTSATGGIVGVIIGALLTVVINYLATRLIDWGFRHGQGELSKSNALKAKTELGKMKSKCKDKESKDYIDKLIKKIDDKIEKYEKE